MFEYFLIFFVLLAAAIAFYLVYERFLGGPRKPDSTLYIEALRDLLDGRPESAFGKLRQVVAEDAENLDAYLRLAQILREHNKPERALQVHKDLTVRRGLPRAQKAAILRQLAEDYIALREYDTASAALKELTGLTPDDRWALQKLLQIHRELKQWDEAYDVAAQILKLDGNKSKRPLAWFRYQMGQEWQKKGEGRKARVLFKEALGLDPRMAVAFIAIGDSYRVEKRDEDAVEYWNKLIETVPEQGHLVIERLERALYDLGRFDEIEDVCRRILEHSPRDVQARLTLAKFYRNRGDLDQADDMLSQVLQQEPAHFGAFRSLVGIYLEQKNTSKISALLKRLESRGEKPPVSPGDDVIDTSLIGIG